MSTINVEFWQGNLKADNDYSGATIEEAYDKAERGMLTDWFLIPPNNIKQEIIETLQKGNEYRNYSWLTFRVLN